MLLNYLSIITIAHNKNRKQQSSIAIFAVMIYQLNYKCTALNVTIDSKGDTENIHLYDTLYRTDEYQKVGSEVQLSLLSCDTDSVRI